MRYKITTIPPKGRNKYGNYSSTSNMSKYIVSYNNGGNGSANGGDDGNNEPITPPKNYSIRLGHNSGNFEWDDIIAQSGQTDNVEILAFGEFENIPTFVGDISLDPDIYGVSSDPNRGYDIKGIVEGMSVDVHNNGTSATSISVKITKDINVSQGTLYIPVSIYTGDENTAPYLPSVDQTTGEYIDNAGSGEDYSEWYTELDNCKTLWLEYKFIVIMNAVNNYTLELTNELAAINCDINGKILTDAVKPSCRAYLYFGENLIEDAVYGINYPTTQGVAGISIDTNTGILTFGSNFNFNGSNLEVTIYATHKNMTTSKIMSINKLYPGKDGSPAVNRWLVPSVDLVKFNPNTNTLSHNTITAKVMKQVGSDAPTEDTETTIYYGWNTTNPITIYSGSIRVVAGYEYLALALKNEQGVIYEYETIPIISEGINGKDGNNGSNGQSVYRLALTNENASINADSNGNIYSTAVKPTCTASLYLGSKKVENAVYSISTTATGVSINSSTGVLTFSTSFNFSGTTTEITIDAKVGNVIYGTAIMTISKSIAGKDGQDGADGADAVSYWLDLSATEVVLPKNATATNPATITLKAFKQVGGNTPTDITSSGYIRWGYHTSSPQNTGTTISNINTGYNYIMVHLVINGVIYDRQTISILKDGKDGANGKDGQNGKDGADGKDGAQGRQGAAIRGPIDWKSVTSSRRWCNGVLTNASYPEDAEFIDVVVFNNNYYKCKTSYSGKGSESTAPSSTYWTQVDSSYAFVATNLLLANNAKIKFATSNELYLMDNSGNVTAGAAGGQGVSFWAGANEPTNANFKVDYAGNLYAKTGTFAGFVQYPYVRTSTLMNGGFCYPGNNAYLLVDSGFYGMGDGCKIKLPAASAALNGFTYNIIAQSNIATKAFDGTYAPKKYGFNHSITLMTENAGRNICQNVFWADAAYLYTTLAFYSGCVVVTCAPSFSDSNSYVWIVTSCQDVDCYIGTTLTVSYSSVISDNSIEKAYYVDSLPATTRGNILYVLK